jgi:hypothetical protein
MQPFNYEAENLIPHSQEAILRLCEVSNLLTRICFNHGSSLALIRKMSFSGGDEPMMTEVIGLSCISTFSAPVVGLEAGRRRVYW